MLGAIVGDFVGSVYEFAPTKNYSFPLVTFESCITDDSIMALAIADALMSVAPDYKERMLYYGRRYPNPKGGYGNSFKRWLYSDTQEPYNSYGNGSAMRAVAVGWVFDSLQAAQIEAAATAEVTHDHPEGIRGAVAVATAVWLARTGGCNGVTLISEMRKLGYDVESFTLADIKPTYGFDETCMGTVPVAIRCFLESTNYEDCIRKAVSLGGDADTLACIAGGIAEAYYGREDISATLAASALGTLPADLLVVYNRFSERFYR